MERRRNDDIETLLDRARDDHPRPPAAPRVQERPPAASQDAVPGYALRPNRPATRRRLSTFNIILALFGAGIAIVLYISNILRVNQLAVQVDSLQTQVDRIENANAVLRAEINRKSTWERVTAMAGTRAGLVVPAEQPRSFTVDPRILERAGAGKDKAP